MADDFDIGLESYRYTVADAFKFELQRHVA